MKIDEARADSKEMINIGKQMTNVGKDFVNMATQFFTFMAWKAGAPAHLCLRQENNQTMMS